MTCRVCIIAAAVLAVSVTAAGAGSKKHRRHVPPVQEDGVPPWRGGRDVGPAHFVRLPNGLIVSSYECFYDEGYGRYLACGAGRK
jgi:hypothetical protein